jgi:hypothetical protein
MERSLNGRHGCHGKKGFIGEVPENDIPKFHGQHAATIETRRSSHGGNSLLLGEDRRGHRRSVQTDEKSIFIVD